MTFSPCFLIPIYNHKDSIGNTLASIAGFDLPCVVVDDGGDEPTKAVLAALEQQYEWVRVIALPQNSGKGAACREGFLWAIENGFTHALQIDADGQHNPQDIPALLAAAKNSPDALVSGCPVYNDSVPRSRLYGRYITHFWVWIETLSLQIKDSMCGFRAYPLGETGRLIRDGHIGERMDFDTDIMVRLYWRGVPVEFVPTAVNYPEDGVSNFDVWKDNLRISKMHTRLFFGMLLRSPILLWRKVFPKKPVSKDQHWASIEERGSAIGIKTLMTIYRWLGRWPFYIALWPVILYFYLSNANARQASHEFLQRIAEYSNNPDSPTGVGASLRQFYEFGLSGLDKLAAWMGDIKYDRLIFPNRSLLLENISPTKGAILVSAHLGNVEACRGMAFGEAPVTINALVFTEHAQKFNHVLKSMNQDSDVNIIPLTDVSPATIVILKEKIERGEVLVIVGDRTSVTAEGRVHYIDFLGKPAPIGQGPFIMAMLLGCPIFSLFGIRQGKEYHAKLDLLATSLQCPRSQREAKLKQVMAAYVANLEKYAVAYPLQWFNFYNFWQSDRVVRRQTEAE
jgi:predicted LPLAT superfamily acyltransferase/GT2 family glycosyltransferase